MIQFKVLDSFLELKKGTSISISASNQIFGFDKIELSRTQEFTVPATEHNNSIFNLSNRADFNGYVARITLYAEMWYSGGKIAGKLYISEASKTEYKCVFVFGELINFKIIKEAGKIKDYLTILDYTKWDDSTAPSLLPVDFAIFKYKIDGIDETTLLNWNFMPSVQLSYLIYAAATRLDVAVSTLSSKVEQLYIKLNGMNGGGLSLAPDSIITAIPGITSDLDYTNFPATLFVQEYTNFLYQNALKSLQDIQITFTPTFPENYGYTKFYIYVLNSENVPIKMFTKEGTKDKETILKLSKGQKITMLGIDYGNNAHFNEPIPMQSKFTTFEGNIAFGDDYYLQPNLPDLTFVDLLKIVANVTNTAIIYDNDINTFSFFDFNSWLNPISLDEKLIKRGNISRTFNDFAQENIIKLKDNENVLSKNAAKSAFYLQNETLEKTKTIAEIQLSGGNNSGYSSATDGLHKFLKLSDIIKNDAGEYEFGKDSDTLCEFVDGSDYLQQVIFDKNDTFLSILEKSTKITVSVNMLLLEFLAIKYNSRFILNGILFCWVTSKWSNDRCELVLQKM